MAVRPRTLGLSNTLTAVLAFWAKEEPLHARLVTGPAVVTGLEVWNDWTFPANAALAEAKIVRFTRTVVEVDRAVAFADNLIWTADALGGLPSVITGWILCNPTRQRWWYCDTKDDGAENVTLPGQRYSVQPRVVMGRFVEA